MKPIIKYQGGKTRELPLIDTIKPAHIEKVIEPFCGGAAVSFHLQKQSILNDVNENLVNLYSVIRNKALYAQFQLQINHTKSLEHDELEKLYYSSRDIINSLNENDYDRAFAYVVVRQLCFSGMERYNSEGKFNVPFGHYKKFTCNLSPSHHEFLQHCEVHQEDAISIIENATDNDWIFLDPPYLNRLGYSTGDGGNDLHNRLINSLRSTSAKWLLIHSDCLFYRKELKDFLIQEKSFQYAQRFGKNKDHSSAAVKHLYITNYNV